MISPKTYVCRLTQSGDKAVANKIVSHCVVCIRAGMVGYRRRC